jgi:3-phenylpropionate/trans-cinnamate dioxygenase ferredoxin reductase component
MMRDYDVLIVGAGHAGAALAAALRQQGFTGSIAMIGAEPEYPYERPPLSKDYLSGEKDFERLLIRPESFWAEKSIDVVLGETITQLDPSERTATTASGQTYRYAELVWAAGGNPRRPTLEGVDLAGVMTVRTRQDADRLSAALPTVNNVVVIGGGYIGLEAAAVLSKFGKAVTLLEMQDRVLARVAGEPLSRFFETEHRAFGVNIVTGATITRIVGQAGKVSGVELGDGVILPADLVLAGIGIEPAVGPLRDAGVDCPNGVRVDAQCRTNLPHICAIGDCALHPNPYLAGDEIRLESVQNANDMAKTVAAVMAGREARYEALPWFWSDQRDLKLQTLGLSLGHDVVVVRGDPATRSFSVVYLKDGRICAIDAVNAVKDYVQAKKLIIERVSILASDLSDAGTELKALWPK